MRGFWKRQPASAHRLQLNSSRQHDLPLVVLRSMFTYCGPEHWPELRLASKQLAEVGREFIGSITVRSWAKQQVPPPALLNALRHRVKLLHVVGKPDWQKLQRLLSCKASHAGPRRGMPQLRHLILQEPHLPLAIPSSCAALLQGISRLDISCPGVLALPRFAELPGLRAASFACTVSLAQLTQLAPNLDQLWAGVLDCSPGSSGTNNKKSTNAAGAAGVMLARLTHLGCRSLSGVHLSTAAVNSSLEAASAAAAAAARTGNSAPAAGMLFPSLKVLTCLPSIAAPCRSTSAQAAGDSSSSRAAFASCLFQTGALGPCPGLQSVRISGNLGYTSAAAALQQLLDSPVELEQLTRLSLHSGSRCVSAFTCINALSQLQQLQHVTVTGSCSRPGRVALLMDQLALLPQLQSLALPAELLCSQCSSSGASGAVQYALDELMMHSSSLTRLVFLPGAAGRLQQQQHGGSSSNNRSSSGGSSSEGGGGSNDDTSCLAGKCGKTQGSSSASEGSSVGSSSLLHAIGGSSSSSSSSRPCRSKACSVCPHPRQVSEKAAMLYSAWQAAAAFEGLSLAADGGAGPAAGSTAPPPGASRTLSNMRERWQQQQQQAKQQEHQQRMQRLQQLQVGVVGLPGCIGFSCVGCQGIPGGGCDGELADSGIGGEPEASQGADVWGVYGSASEW